MKLKKKIRAKLEKNKYAVRFINDYAFRSLVLSFSAFVINTAYAAYNAYFGAVNRSFWFVSLAVYFIILSLMRGGIVLSEYRVCKGFAAEKNDRKPKTYLATGVMLLLLAIALCGVVVMMNAEGRAFERPGLLIYVAATYTFYKITLSVVNLVRVRKQNDYALSALRYIGLSDALVSLLVLQTAMLVEFDKDGLLSNINVITGSVICLFTVGLGIFMIINAGIKLRKKEEENG